MLSIEEIRTFINEDAASEKKFFARQGQRYYEADHDILNYRLFYYNDDGELVEDETRSNVKIPHPFFAELVDQTVQYLLSGKDGYVMSDDETLQEHLDEYFNNNEEFKAELAETITGCMVKGFDYMHAYRDAENKLCFENSDAIGVVEVRAKDTDDKCEHIVFWYIDRIDKGRKKIKRIQVWDSEQVYFYSQIDDGAIEEDETEEHNPRPHTLYQEDGQSVITYDSFGYIPFFRMDYNKKQISALKPVKPLIDDYDLMASSLSNNLIDFDTPIHVVKGMEGTSLEEVRQNLRTKKAIGIPASDGGVDVKTVDVPYQARLTKLELDEKNIYRAGMGLNTAGLKDTSATTNIAIKAAYSLLELKCEKLKIQLQRFLRKLTKVVIAEINAVNGTGFTQSDVYFSFEPEIMSNEQENAQIKLTEAQAKQTEVNTILNVAEQIGDEEAIKAICDILEIDYADVKKNIPEPDDDTAAAQKRLDALPTVEDLQQKGENGQIIVPV